MSRKKPTRQDLLVVIDRLQGLIGAAMGQFHDRNPQRQAQVSWLLNRAHDLCIDARGFDPAEPSETSPWADKDGSDKKYTEVY